MEKQIKKLESKSLSSDELLKLVNHKANLVLYSELYKYKSLDQLLRPHGAAIILYETRKNYGHWTTVFKLDNKTIEFFDPYGVFLDDELNWIDRNFRFANHEYEPYLSRLLYYSKYHLTYNHHKFQKFKKDVNTCGRWVGLRLLYRNLSLNKFINIFTNKSKYNADFFATLLTRYV